MKRALGEIWVLFNFAIWNNCALIYTQWFIDDYLSKKGCYATGVRTTNNLWTNVLYVCISIFFATPTSKSFTLWRILHYCKQPFAVNLRTVIAYKRLFSHPWSWTRAHRTAKLRTVKFCFPRRTQNVSRSFRHLGPVFQSWSFALVSCCSWARHRRNGVRFLKYPHGLIDRYGIPVQRSISERDVSHPIY